MADQHWIRKCHVSVAGTELDMSDMHVEFQVRLYEQPNPDWCYIRMYNLSNETSNGMFQKGAEVQLQAGYKEGKYGLIFKGTGQQQRRGKLPNGVDKYHDVVAVTNSEAYSYGTVNKALDKDWSLQDAWKEAQKAFEEKGAQIGDIAKLSQKTFKKPITLFGMARDVANWVAETDNKTWHFDHEGKLNLVNNDGFLGGDTLEISADTGMVGLPEQTLDGINVKIFLNPNVRKGQKVHIDEKSIQRLLLGTGIGAATLGFGADQFGIPNLNVPQSGTGLNPGQVPRISADGIYKVVKVDHDGSMEGQEWYTTLICLAPGDSTSKFGGSGDSGADQGKTERGMPEEVKQGGQGGGGSGGQ